MGVRGIMSTHYTRKEVTADVAGQSSNLIINTSKSPAGMTETDLAGLLSVFKGADIHVSGPPAGPHACRDCARELATKGRAPL